MSSSGPGCSRCCRSRFLVWWWLLPYRARLLRCRRPERLARDRADAERGAVVLQRRAPQMIAAILIWLLIVAALARPQWAGDPLTHEVSAWDLILAVDIAGSMDQPDFRNADGQTLTRLDGVKRVIRDFIGRRHGDRIALILLGTRAYMQVPFTQDLATAELLLEQTQVGMAGQQTAIGDAIGLSIKTFEKSTAKQKLLILLTDGNDTASRVPPEHAADIARQNGVVVYTIGVGDPAASGENRVDLDVLQTVASTTDGHFFRAEDGGATAGHLRRHRQAGAGKTPNAVLRPKLPLFQWPLGAGVLLALSLWFALLMAGVRGREEWPAMHEAATIPFHLLRPQWLVALVPDSRSSRWCCGGSARKRNGAAWSPRI